MTYDEWFDTYKPYPNTIDPNASFDGYMWETFGPEHDQVLSTPEEQIWTIIETDSGLVLVEGYGYVDHFGHFICAVPYGSLDPVEIPLEVTGPTGEKIGDIS